MIEAPLHDQELIDAVVAAIDIERVGDVDRLRAVFARFGLEGKFNDELRLSGHANHLDRIQALEDEANDLDRELASAVRRADAAEEDNAKLRKKIAELEQKIADLDQGKAAAK